MPLCPQITLTPVTVTSSNMTVTSVVAGGVPATYEQLSTTDAAAQQALADATQAIADAATAYSTAVAANTAAGVAQATADGKNRVTYSTSTPGSTANTAGDIWYQYGTTAPNVGRIIAQYMGAGGTSWTQTTVSGLVVANLDAGSITTGTITAAIGITNPSGNFTVNGATGALTATGATVTGTITATTGSFTGSIFSTSGTIGGWSIGSTSISKTVGTRTTTLNASNGFIDVYDSSTGFLAGGAISVGTPSVTTSISSAGVSFGSDAVVDVRNELGGYSGILRIYAPSNKYIRLVPNAGNASATYPVYVEGSFQVTGNYIGPVTVTTGAVYTGTATLTPSDSTEGVALTQGGTVNARRSNNNPLNLHIFNVTAATTTSVPIIQFIRNGTNRGTLEVFGNTTAPTLVGSSDYRLKENIRDYTGALSKLMAAKVRVFNEKEDDKKNDIVGFVAHEFAEIFPDFVGGEKDAVDSEGNPIYQKLGYGNLVPHLVRAIQELKSELDALKGGN